MELIKRQIHCNRMGKHTVNQFYMDEDINVPDVKEDMLHIIQGEGYIKIEDVKPAETFITVLGKLYYHVLYATAGDEARLAVLEGKVPFEETVYTEDEQGVQYVVRATRVDFSATLIHSRKLTIRAMIELDIIREELGEEETTIDVDNPILYKKKRSVNLLEMNTMKRDNYRVKEEINLPGTKESMEEILIYNVANRKLEIRPGQDELRIRGELLVFVLYTTGEGSNDWVEQIVPFEGRMDCYGIEEGMYHHAYASLEDPVVEARINEDGEMRILGIESTISLRIYVYQEEQMELLEDVYSLSESCEIQTKKAVYEELLLQNQSRCKVTEQLLLPELKEDVLQICHSDGNLQIDNETVTEEGILLDGVLYVTFLYIKADDKMPYTAWQGMVPFSHLLESKELPENIRFDITSHVEQLAVSLMGNGEVEIKAVLAFDTFIRKMLPIEMITDITLSPREMKEQETSPGIIGYIVKDGDYLWDLAKKYLTTVEGIMDVNELESESVKPGDRLLIFKENVSIL